MEKYQCHIFFTCFASLLRFTLFWYVITSIANAIKMTVHKIREDHYVDGSQHKGRSLCRRTVTEKTVIPVISRAMQRSLKACFITGLSQWCSGKQIQPPAVTGSVTITSNGDRSSHSWRLNFFQNIWSGKKISLQLWLDIQCKIWLINIW